VSSAPTLGPGVEERSPPSLTAPSVLLGASILMWSASLGSIDLRAMDDTGLTSVLPVTALLAFALLTMGFCLALHRGAGTALLLAYLVALVLMAYGTVSVVGEGLRGAVVWRHLGVTDALVRLRRPDPTIDAYFNWPGFFMLLSMVQTLAGAEALAALARWAPVVFNLLFLGPLVLIVRSVTPNRTQIWLTSWVFLVSNWISQDYLAPQALAFFFYLVLVFVLLRKFPAGTVVGHQTFHADRAALAVVIVLLFAVTVASHQLTPFAALIAVSLLVVSRRCSARGLPLVMGLLAVSWLLFMAVPYLKGHAAELTSEVGSVSSAVGKNVGERVRGSAGHLFVVRIRLLFTAGMWALAALGALRQWRSRRLDVRIVLLAVAPFPLLVAQPYGGEMLLRVYLFSLPFASVLAAAALLPNEKRRLRAPVLAAVLTVMLGAFLVSRYGNERMDQFTSQEVAAVDQLYAIVPPGGLLLAASGNLPWKDRAYEQYDYRTAVQLAQTTPAPQILDAVETAMQRRPASALILTRSQRASIELLGTLPATVLQELEQHVVTSDRFRLAYANADARIFVLDPGR
jgi:hypothetical protein